MQPNNLPEKILIVDDDPTVAETLKEPLQRQNIKVLGAHDLETAMYQFNQNRLDVVVVELEFEPNPGLALIQKWRKHEIFEKRLTSFIVATGNRTDQKSFDVKLMTELQDIEAIVKPYTALQLLPILARAKATKIRNLKFEETKQTIFKLANHKPEKAIELVKKQLKDLGPKGFEILAEVYENNKMLDEGIQIANQVLDKDPVNIAWLNYKGRLLLQKGDVKEALKCMEIADREAPGNIERINNLATAYLQAKQPDKSSEKMAQLIKLHPETPDLRFDMFSKLHDFGFDQHAQELCKKTTSPIEVVRHYNNKGVALSKNGNVQGALLEYERSMQYFPKFKENYRILYNIALAQTTFKTRKNYEVALEYLERCLQLKPDFEKAINTREQIKKILDKSSQAS